MVWSSFRPCQQLNSCYWQTNVTLWSDRLFVLANTWTAVIAACWRRHRQRLCRLIVHLSPYKNFSSCYCELDSLSYTNVIIISLSFPKIKQLLLKVKRNIVWSSLCPCQQLNSCCCCVLKTLSVVIDRRTLLSSLCPCDPHSSPIAFSLLHLFYRFSCKLTLLWLDKRFLRSTYHWDKHLRLFQLQLQCYER